MRNINKKLSILNSASKLLEFIVNNRISYEQGMGIIVDQAKSNDWTNDILYAVRIRVHEKLMHIKEDLPYGGVVDGEFIALDNRLLIDDKYDRLRNKSKGAIGWYYSPDNINEMHLFLCDPLLDNILNFQN